MQIAINERFWNTFDEGYHFSIAIQNFKVENLQQASKTTLEILEDDLNYQLAEWLEAPKEAFKAFTSRLTDNGSLISAFELVGLKRLNRTGESP